MEERPPRPILGRPPNDDSELDAWADDFAAAILGVISQVP